MLKARELRVFLGTSFVVAASVAGNPAQARGASPYLPLNLAPEIERQIERVLILADKPILKRPIAAATVLDALPRACAIDAELCGRVRAYIGNYMRSLGIVAAGIDLAASNDIARPLPNRHGLSSDSSWAADIQFLWQPGDHILLTLGGYGHADEVTPTGSMLSLGWEYAQLDVGYRDHWLSPLYESAMLMSSNASTVPSVTLSNYTPITRLGLGYEFFISEISESDRIAVGDGFTSGNPRVAAVHLSMEPAAGYALGANRLVQCGGGARGSCSLHDIFDALINPYESDNRQQGLTQDQEVGNQQAAFTSQFVFPGVVPFTVYFEYAGEDTSYDSDYRAGNAALSAGIRFPRLWKLVDLVYEASEWQNSWYLHGIYQDGLRHEGRVLGHWGADYRVSNDAVGAQAHMIGVGWMPPFGGVIQATYRTVANESYSSFDYERAHIIALRYSRGVGEYTVGGEVVGGRDVFGEDFTRFAAFARFGPLWAGGGRSAVETQDVRQHGAELFIDAGYNLTEMHVIRGDVNASLKTKLGTKGGASIGIGARRAVSERSDLGARIDLSEIHDEYLLAVRALDYRYRFNQRWAATAFIGAARYDVGLPAYGWYLGAGAQWRNVLPNVDLSVDYRFADKVARDKLLPTDPATNPRDDIFFDMYGAVVSVSYRW